MTEQEDADLVEKGGDWFFNAAMAVILIFLVCIFGAFGPVVSDWILK